MTEKIIDSEVIEATLTDFANLYGDDDLMDIIKGWHQKKYGIPLEKFTLDCKAAKQDGFSHALKQVSYTVEKLKRKSEEKSTEYLMGVYQASLEIIKDLHKKGKELI